nr:MAG TPA: hypothetical protein [Caudoviricetes sp.]
MPAIFILANHVQQYPVEYIQVCNILSVAPANNLRNSLHGRVTAFLIPHLLVVTHHWIILSRFRDFLHEFKVSMPTKHKTPLFCF